MCGEASEEDWADGDAAGAALPGAGGCSSVALPLLPPPLSSSPHPNILSFISLPPTPRPSSPPAPLHYLISGSPTHSRACPCTPLPRSPRRPDFTASCEEVVHHASQPDVFRNISDSFRSAWCFRFPVPTAELLKGLSMRFPLYRLIHPFSVH